MRKIVFALLIVLVVIGFLFGVMRADTNVPNDVSSDTNLSTNSVPLQTPTPVSIWTLNPMEIWCNHSSSLIGTAMCINALISHIVNRPTQLPTPTPTPIPNEPRLQKFTEMADEIFYCEGDCIARVELHFNNTTVFHCPDDRSISLYFEDQVSGWAGYLTGESIVDWRVTARGTIIYVTTHLMQELGESAQVPEYYTMNLYCAPPRTN